MSGGELYPHKSLPEANINSNFIVEFRIVKLLRLNETQQVTILSLDTNLEFPLLPL